MNNEIFIVGFEADFPNVVSFWDWYATEKEMEDRINELKNTSDLNGILYFGEITIPSEEKIYPMDINGYVEIWLEKNNWEVDYILSHDTYSSHPLAHKYETDMSLYGDDYYDLHDCLETVEKKTDYKMWFSGHYHDDMIHYSDSNKPCLTLFDKVLLLDNIDEEIKSLTKI